MSAPAIETPVVEVVQSTRSRTRMPIWHNAATWDDLLSALAGGPYTAKCGARCRGAKGVSRHRSTLPPMEKCAVCADLWGVAL